MNASKKKPSLFYNPCHEGTIKVFEDPTSSVPYHGGGSSRDLVIYPGHLIVSMANLDLEVVQICNFKAPNLLKYNNPVVYISCPDYSVPSLGKKFWLDLIDTINIEWQAGRITGVTVCCVGGHGRTGTALSILASLTGRCESDPVAFVRKHYCEKAVESKGQIEYIEAMTGTKVNIKIDKRIYGYQNNLNLNDVHDYYGHTPF